MIRIVLTIVAVSVVFLGLWMIATGFVDPAPGATPGAQTLSAPRQTASPVILGTALLAGGVGFLVLVLRRR